MRHLALSGGAGDAAKHAIRWVYPGADPENPVVETLRSLPAVPFGQRHQAHPFLSPDRTRLFHTEVVDGFSQVSSIDVRDLTDRDGYWGALRCNCAACPGEP